MNWKNTTDTHSRTYFYTRTNSSVVIVNLIWFTLFFCPYAKSINWGLCAKWKQSISCLFHQELIFLWRSFLFLFFFFLLLLPLLRRSFFFFQMSSVQITVSNICQSVLVCGCFNIQLIFNKNIFCLILSLIFWLVSTIYFTNFIVNVLISLNLFILRILYFVSVSPNAFLSFSSCLVLCVMRAKESFVYPAMFLNWLVLFDFSS